MTINFSLLASTRSSTTPRTSATCSAASEGAAGDPHAPGRGHQLGPTHSHCLEAMFLQVPDCCRGALHGRRREGLLKAAIRDDNP